MDPLSITASVAGFLGAVEQSLKLLRYLSSVMDAPSTIQEAQIEFRHAEIALRALQGYLQRLEYAQPRRTSPIQSDDLLITLPDAY